jgi:hypothetical protein
MPLVARIKRHAFAVGAAFCLAMSLGQVAVHLNGRRYVRAMAWDIVEKAHANDPRSRVIALRDYLRLHVENKDYRARPFLRSSAADVLRSGNGYCGEATRAFICLAEEIGIPAQRITLYGPKRTHVVAVAEITPEGRVVVDSFKRTEIENLAALDEVVAGPDYNDYSSLNWRRFHLGFLAHRFEMRAGRLSYWIESPAVIKAVGWLVLAVTVFLFGALRAHRRH